MRDVLEYLIGAAVAVGGFIVASLLFVSVCDTAFYNYQFGERWRHWNISPLPVSGDPIRIQDSDGLARAYTYAWDAGQNVWVRTPGDGFEMPTTRPRVWRRLD